MPKSVPDCIQTDSLIPDRFSMCRTPLERGNNATCGVLLTVPQCWLVACHAFIGRLCATGFASAPHLQEALAEPVAHFNPRLTEHQASTMA